MKLKKAKKMLKKLGVERIAIREYEGDEDQKDEYISTKGDHDLDDAEVVNGFVGYDNFEIEYRKASKKEKKKKKKRDIYGEELARIQRNLKHTQTGEGKFEDSAEEIEKREEQRQLQDARRRKEEQRREKERNSDNSEKEYSSNHHQNQEANRNNQRRYNNRNQNSSSKENGTDNVSNKPDNSEEKEE